MSVRVFLCALVVSAPLTAAGLATLIAPRSLRSTDAVAADQTRAAPSGGASDAAAATTMRGVRRELELRGYLPAGLPVDRVARLLPAAIAAFEHDHGLPITGEPSDAILRALVLGYAAGGRTARTPVSETARRLHGDVGAALTALGYGAAGQTPAHLAEAIGRFERERQMPATGRISAALVTALETARVLPPRS